MKASSNRGLTSKAHVGPRTARSKHSVPSSAQRSDPAVRVLEVDGPLRDWIHKEGGRVDPRIALVERAPCGARGIVALEDIPASEFPSTLTEETADQLVSSALILVPEFMYMSSSHMNALLREVIDGLKPMERLRRLANKFKSDPRSLPPVLQLGLLLAHEKAIGAESFWEPYIRTLPAEIPCGWAQSPYAWAETAIAIASAFPKGLSESEIIRDLATARIAIDTQCKTIWEAWGDLLDVPSASDLRWGFGQAVSRCFGNDEECALAPYIDLCNHTVDGLRPTGSGDFYAVVPAVNGEPRGLRAGEELYISYSSKGRVEGAARRRHSSDASAAEDPERRGEVLTDVQRSRRCVQNYLSFGFVLPEDLEGAQP